MSRVVTADEEVLIETYQPCYNPIRLKPVLVDENTLAKSTPLFLNPPFVSPLLFKNEDSDARDHCACERTFLSWLRLAIYMAIVSVAVVISFHLKHQPTPLERRMALPLGLVFWFLSLCCLMAGFANYIKTVTKYSRKEAIVQHGWKTQVVFTVVASAIVGACILLLVTNVQMSH
ncbi:MAG: hypothetical protein M1817_005440 [Caeruleum heppii]|nr:MAG: hypothetical protein M1817_005440 [Caeruleum heppii]